MTLNVLSLAEACLVESGLDGVDDAVHSSVVYFGVIFVFTVKVVLGGESSCTTSVSEAASVDIDVAGMPAPDEADVGAGGVVVMVTGWWPY